MVHTAGIQISLAGGPAWADVDGRPDHCQPDRFGAACVPCSASNQ